MSYDIAIKVENVSKCYQIYDAPRDRLKQFVMPRVQGLLGRDARRYYREFWALRDVSFEIRSGETVGIVGRNGSGKSTLLQMICGTLNPTSGNIETRGRIAALLELGSGFNPEFTGRENVYMNAAVLGLKREEIEARFDDIVAFADIGHFLEQPVKTYSSGMVVRLAFAVQAMIDPDILVVDEALAVGDEKFQRKCFARLEELKGRGTSIIFVSHSAPSIIELCDRALLIDNGVRVMYAEPLQAVRAYQKMIYAPEHEHQTLLKMYIAADRAGEVLPGAPPELDGIAEPSSASVTTATADSVQPTIAFDPALVPETTSVYPVQGAQIDTIVILDEHDQVTNLLTPKANYRFQVSGQILENFPAIYFGLHVRNTQGAVITGQRYPADGINLTEVKAGQSFKLTFVFDMHLVPGTYFVGGGIWSTQEPLCAHRIMDAIMFRVTQVKNNSSLGYVDLTAAEPVLEFA